MPSFTTTIPDNEYANVKAAWLAVFPLPQTAEGLTIDNPSTGEPWTENDWLKANLKGVLIKITKQGYKKLKFLEAQDNYQNGQSDYDDSFDIT